MHYTWQLNMSRDSHVWSSICILIIHSNLWFCLEANTAMWVNWKLYLKGTFQSELDTFYVKMLVVITVTSVVSELSRPRRSNKSLEGLENVDPVSSSLYLIDKNVDLTIWQQIFSVRTIQVRCFTGRKTAASMIS